MRQTFQRKNERSASMPIAVPIDNVELNEPSDWVYVVKVDNLMNGEDQTQVLKTDGKVLKKGGKGRTYCDAWSVGESKPYGFQQTCIGK